MITLRLRERNWMPKSETCNGIRKRLVTIWIFPCICFDFRWRCAGETQTTEKCMEKFKLWLNAIVCGYMPQILVFSFPLVTLEFSIHNLFRTGMLLEIFDAEFPYKLSYFEPLCLLNKTVKRSIVLLYSVTTAQQRCDRWFDLLGWEEKRI